jgi:quercetin dioxygenase-like cupin family protein
VKNILHWALLMAVVESSGCATTRYRPEAALERQGHVHGESGPAATASTGKSFRSLSIPAEDPAGPERQVSVLLDGSASKIVSIRLRKGADLPEHTAPNPVTIQAISGTGTIKLGQETVHLDAGHLVALEPNVPHAVVPDSTSDLVLLVIHIRRSAAH